LARDTVNIGNQSLALQALPIGLPRAIPQRQWGVQRQAHGRANARFLTANEVAERHQSAREATLRREAREAVVEADNDGILAEQEEDDSQTITVQMGPLPSASMPPWLPQTPLRRPTTPWRPATPPHDPTVLVFRTTERPPPRRAPNPEATPERLPPASAAPA
jgi:hypothetical protein